MAAGGGTRTWQVVLALLATAGCAHFPRLDEPTLDLEPSTLGIPLADRQVFESQLAGHAYLHNGLDRPRLFDEGGFAATLALSFLVTFRMYDAPSTPIVPPSYFPRLRLQLVEVLPVGDSASAAAQRLLAGVDLFAAHYSNGQGGCALRNRFRNAGPSDFDCRQVPGAPLTNELNLENGSFTDHLLGAGVFARWLLFPPVGGSSRAALTARGGIDGTCLAASRDASSRRCARAMAAPCAGPGPASWWCGTTRTAPSRSSRAWPEEARLRLTASGAVHVGASEGRTPLRDLGLELAYLTRFEHGGTGGPFVRRHFGRLPEHPLRADAGGVDVGGTWWSSWGARSAWSTARGER